ncbi:MAG: ComEC family competence protein [Candidatus Pacebacteria bacterium]|nr:ComEC family competence protein [Candidatus Paceibacterota bacterium]
MSSRLLYSIILGFAVGVLVRSYVVVPDNIYVYAVVTACIVFCIGYMRKKYFQSYVLIFLIILSGVLGSVRFAYDETRIQLPYEDSVGKKITLSGTIIDEVEKKQSNQRFVLQDDATHAQVLVSTDIHPVYVYGDIVEVTGKLQKPDNFITDQGKEFDYISYLAKDRIYYTMSFASLSVTGHKAPSRIREMLFTFKRRLEKNIGSVVREPESTFLGGIALGSRAGISPQLRDDFITTGTIHIVALSGYNISIVAKYIQDFFGAFLSFYFSLVVGAIAVVFFVLMTGAQATAVRAGIMAILVLLARGTGRTYEITRALMVAGFLMILHNPMVMAFDVSFQLSFLATLGIIYLNPVCSRWLGKKDNEMKVNTVWIRVKREIRDIIATTLAAQIMVLPFILYKMGTLSLVSLPINIIILPFIPVAMALGFIIALLGFAGSWLTLPIGLLVTLLLAGVLAVIEWGAHLPHAMLTVSHVPLVFCIAIYVFLGWWVYAWRQKHVKV